MTAGAITGADALVLAAAHSGIELCFANPGTTEMPLVASLDRIPGVRAVLGLHENVCTGAADGYARISGHAAMTLLHLGPGLANGLANLHNARRAHTPVVNIVGDHATWHRAYDAPLSSDIAALATTVGTVHQVAHRNQVAEVTRLAIEGAHRQLCVSTVVVPADHQQSKALESPLAASHIPTRTRAESSRVEKVAARLRQAGPRAAILLGGNALTRVAQQAASRIASATGATFFSETFPARAERGGGLPNIDRLPYFPEKAVAALKDTDAVVVAGAEDPVAYFGYEGIPSVLSPPGTLVRLARPREDAEAAHCLSSPNSSAPQRLRYIARPSSCPTTIVNCQVSVLVRSSRPACLKGRSYRSKVERAAIRSTRLLRAQRRTPC